MDLIHIPSLPKIAGVSAVEPITKLELDLLVGYRRLSVDDQERMLSVLQAMVAVNCSSDSPRPQR